MPQSNNSIVERANGVIKRIINKLIFNHMNVIDDAVKIYNDTMNVSTGKIPNYAALFQLTQDIENVKDSIREKAIKPAPYMNNYKLNQFI